MWDTGTSGDKMLTSGSTQYLHPDYLQPLPTTLDAKKSPLALLAQTCSSIGKDSTPAKSLIPPIEKKDAQKDKDSSGRSKTESPNGKTSPAQDRSRSQPSASDRKESNLSPSSKRSESPKSGFRAPKDLTSSSSSKSPSSPSTLSKSGDRETTSTTSVIQPTPSTSQSNSRISINCGNMMLEVNHNESQSKSSSSLPGSSRADPAAPLPPTGLPPHLGAAYHGLHLPGLGHHLPMDLHASSAYAAALSAHSGLLKPGLGGTPNSAAALSSYLGYARVKTPTGAHTLVPVCKDPYCNHCQASAQAAQLGGSATGACAAGCTQCTHGDKPGHMPITSLSSHSAALGGLPFFPGALGAAPGMSPLALSSLYPHAFGAQLNGLPYVCNWMNGSDYCGKRFTNSEDLLQHLRTHTSDSSALAAAALPYAGLGLSAYQSPLAGATPGSLSPNSALRAHYPRSLSPSSLLAASRYHPYKSALSSLTTPPVPTPGALPVSLPSALPHYPPYGLFGRGLGAAVTP